MSYHCFFSLTTGLTKPMLVPAGTLARMRHHVAHVESTLGFETTKYLDNPPQRRVVR